VLIATARKKRKLAKEAIGETLVADTDSEPGSEANDFEDYFAEEEEEKIIIIRRRTTTAAAASLSRSRNTGCNKWQLTNMGTTSRKEHKYFSFCWTSKRCEKK
jgi:hypothetical protein